MSSPILQAGGWTDARISSLTMLKTHCLDERDHALQAEPSFELDQECAARQAFQEKSDNGHHRRSYGPPIAFARRRLVIYRTF
ncbi:MAG: hypothetical protein KGS45_10745 [Planctomycetes bacterium]|nr:hypothetical protein [Planctomycetota bacterium]